jgi:hypothetical protein
MNVESFSRVSQEMSDIISNADYFSVDTIDSPVSMREFISGAFSYYPRWLKTLYRIRLGLVKILRIGPSIVPGSVIIKPENVPMSPNSSVSFFKLEFAKEDRFWVVSATESHLTAYLGVVVEKLQNANRFYLLTIVHYRSWAGPVYFNTIKPFERVVMNKMLRAGATGTASS